ncbi:MAG: malate dehydrogenase [Oceanobacter sp.]
MKVSIIGLGKVGSSLAFILSTRSFIRELVLVGRTRESVMGDVLDLRHGQLFVEAPTRITAGLAEDTAGSDIIVFCAAAPTPPDMSNRLAMAPNNVALMAKVLPELAWLSPRAKILIASNPVDVLVHFAIELTGLPERQILGTGTLLDSARFRQLLAEELGIHMEDIRANILGEHGDSQFPAMSCANAGGEPLDATPERYEMARQAARAGFDVFSYKGHTNYAIALAAADIVQIIARDTRHTMPVSLKVDGFLGVDDLCLSLPAVVGQNGIERVLHPSLNEQEQQAFLHSADVVRQTIQRVEASEVYKAALEVV